MTLSELKEPYSRIFDKKLDRYTCTEVADMYLSSSSDVEKNKYISYLICKSWNNLSNIYYKNNKTNLSAEECYDIFIQTLNYVISSHAWTREDSSLNGDNKAFEKAMAITIVNRKKNYVNSKFRQKRFANFKTSSLDLLEEDFTDGYFSRSYDNHNEDYIIKVVNNKITIYFKKKHYLAAFILDAIIFDNVFDEYGNFSIKKLKKYIRQIDEKFCKNFTNKYGLNYNEVKNSLKYFEDDIKLENKIKYSLNILQCDEDIENLIY